MKRVLPFRMAALIKVLQIYANIYPTLSLSLSTCYWTNFIFHARNDISRDSRSLSGVGLVYYLHCNHVSLFLPGLQLNIFIIQFDYLLIKSPLSFICLLVNNKKYQSQFPQNPKFFKLFFSMLELGL